MNKKFKVGDTVVLVNGRYLDALEINLAKERHLFEIEGVANDIVNLKSISANLETEIHVEYIRHATLKERFLRDGNSVVFDGIGYLVSGNAIIGLESGLTIDYFDDDLLMINDKRFITEVFNNSSRKFENKINVNHKLTTILWKRKPEINLTRDEVIILKNVDGRFKYITRDNLFGSLSLFEKEPTKSSVFEAYVSDVASNWQHLSPFNNLFRDITFESGVHLIDDLIKWNEKRKN